DATAKADDYLFETALANVILRSKYQSGIRSGFGVGRLRMKVPMQGLGIKQHEILFKRFCLRQDDAIGTDHDARAIEDQAVIPADLITHHYRHAEVGSDGLQHLFADFSLVNGEWRC